MQVYRLPNGQSTPEGSFAVRYKEPRNRGNVEGQVVHRSQIVGRQTQVEVPVEPAPLSLEARAQQRQVEMDAERARLQAESERLADVSRRLEVEDPNFGREGAPRPSSARGGEEGNRGEEYRGGEQ